MTWAVYSNEFGGLLHISGSLEGARRWVKRSTTLDRVDLRHTASIPAPDDAVTLFRMFLKQTGYWQGLVGARLVAEAFNDWLKRKHPLTESFSTQRMVSVLKSWGTKRANHSTVKHMWFLSRTHICSACGGYVDTSQEEKVCTHCGETEVLR